MIYIITGPSGVGKNTIIEAMSTDLDFYFSVSHTTRPQREGEEDGKDYHFVTEERFKNLVDENLMIEYEQYGGFYYGTSKKEILKESNIILLDLEVNGATKLLSENDDFIGIFIDIDDKELVKRLKNRGHDQNFIDKRMQLASMQREKKSQYQYHVDNVDIKSSVNQILDIIYALEES
jgi:guanylate kinase|tara:strand:- start:236 stop:769 length:534 start_codon:yes stop_codon:yes gene_type:complete